MKERRASIREGPVLGVQASRPAASPRGRVLVGLLAFLVLLTWCAVSPVSAFADADAIITPTHYADNTVARGDDSNNLVVNLPFAMNWLGTPYSQIYINMNGNCTFVDPYCDSNYPETYQSHDLTTTRYYAWPRPYLPIIAPFFADVDTSNGGSGQLTYSGTATPPTFEGHNCFIVNWIDVMSYNNGWASANTNSFQMVLVDRSDTGAGNFDIMFNYNTINWDTGTATGGQPGRAVVGWSTAQGADGSYELAGSLAPMGGPSALLDSSSSSTSLIQNSLDSGGVLGRYIWQVRNGTVVNVPPTISLDFTTKTLEANSTTGYTGYSGATDAQATDGDGTVVSFTRNPVAGSLLPFGSTEVTWTATDDDGATTVATQTITVVDTTPPTQPWAWSPTHVPNVWSGVATMTAAWSVSTDAGSGLAGYSFSWTRDAPGLPDTATDTVTYTPGVTASVTEENQAFDGASFPADWTEPASNDGFLRITGAAGRYHLAPNAAEVWANSNTYREDYFYKTYDLSAFQSATLTWWDSHSAFNRNANFESVSYSTDGGATWTDLYYVSGRPPAQNWTQHSVALPNLSSAYMVRFGANVRGWTEYVDWDEISIVGVVPTPNSTSAAPGDGHWYFNVRAVDGRDNWNPTATSIGPFLIESFPPISTCNIPVGWTSSLPSISITATDAGSGVAYTRYRYDGSPWANYTAPFPPGVDGTHTLNFYSVDNVGHIETAQTAILQLDTTPPSIPTSVGASAVSTTSIEVSWAPSTDAQSGVSYYAVYRDGSLVTTTTALAYTDTSLTPGTSYSYYIVAYNHAGLTSAHSVTVVGTTPDAALWMSLSADTVYMGAINPGESSTVASATTVLVGGVGDLTYDLWCSAEDFTNTDSGSVTPTMPVDTLTYSTSGWIVQSEQPFTVAPYKLDTSAGDGHVWEHDYRFDFVLTPPWAFDPGTYATTVTYTVVCE